MKVTQGSRQLRLVMYTRVSTLGQIDGYGLDSQARDGNRWAKSAGARVVKTLREKALSGRATMEERPELLEAMRMIQDHEVDGILAPNLDRLARELTIQEAVLAFVWAHGARAFSADHGEHLEDDESDPMRTALRQMRGVFSQLERGLIRKRLRDGREVKADKGGYAYGAPRYGQQAKNNELVPLRNEAKWLAQMEAWRVEGLSYRGIADRLAAEGVSTKRGKLWHPATIQRALDENARERARQQSSRARADKKAETRRTRARRILLG